MIQGHGGNVYGLSKKLGCNSDDIVDMSSNINPLGPPQALVSYLQNHFSVMCRLPESDAQTVIDMFSAYYSIPSNHILAGNGTTQFIYTAPQALKMKNALIIGPTYADYADACKMYGVNYTYGLATPETQFVPDRLHLKSQINAADTVFICNPNNPTGILLSWEVLSEWIQAFPNTRFIIDESYLPFVGDHAQRFMTASFKNVIVLYSMSKIFCIPGLRIGFLIAHPTYIEAFQHYSTPWSMNAFAQESAKYLLSHDMTDFVTRTQQYIHDQRMIMEQRIRVSPQLKVFPSTTGFMLIQLLGQQRADSICETLASQRILIRNCANFIGLSNAFIRISVKKMNENLDFLDKLLKIV
ncbi:MAG: pyridoxal phosphate-dependent class II aminotransferase [Desulfobacterales bacterium]|nr:pyridoxal phosphate-dependent class II aminotransferase [Desulfobacterales bacterium]